MLIREDVVWRMLMEKTELEISWAHQFKTHAEVCVRTPYLDVVSRKTSGFEKL